MSDEFKHYFVDVHEAGAVGRLATALRVHGVATFEGIDDRRAIVRLGSRLMRIAAHRHSEQDGVTVIDDRRPDGSSVNGSVGFTRRRLAPHTDCSALARPPGLLLMVCQRPAATGGDCVLVDGQRVYYAAGGEPGLLRELRAPLSVMFGHRAGNGIGHGTDHGSGYHGSIFTRVEPDRVVVRLRLDEQARFAPGLQLHLPALRRLLHLSGT